MMLSDDDVRAFAAEWKEEYGEEISEGDARIRLFELVQLYKALSQPLPKKDNESNDTHAA